MLFNINRTTALILAATAIGATAGWTARWVFGPDKDSEVGATEGDEGQQGVKQLRIMKKKEQLEETRNRIQETDTLGISHLAIYQLNRELIDMGVITSGVMVVSQDISNDRERAENRDTPFREYLERQTQTLIDICEDQLRLSGAT